MPSRIPSSGEPRAIFCVGSQDYYSKWDKFAKDTTDAIEAEDEKLEQENDDKLGKTKYAASEAEQKDRETNERLKEAKKVFDRRRELEEQSKLQIADQV